MRCARYLSLALLLSLSLAVPASAAAREHDGQRESRLDRVMRIVQRFIGIAHDTLIIPFP